jgi:hypothetical protein
MARWAAGWRRTLLRAHLLRVHLMRWGRGTGCYCDRAAERRSMGTWLLALATLAAGLRGAWYWYRSSQVVAAPAWVELGQAEPADPLQSQMGWLAALIKAGGEAAYFNRWAAIWTAGAVVPGGCRDSCRCMVNLRLVRLGGTQSLAGSSWWAALPMSPRATRGRFGWGATLYAPSTSIGSS